MKKLLIIFVLISLMFIIDVSNEIETVEAACPADCGSCTSSTSCSECSQCPGYYCRAPLGWVTGSDPDVQCNSGNQCDVVSCGGTSFQCRGNSWRTGQCSGSTPYCPSSGSSCVECTSSSQCGTNERCSSGSCINSCGNPTSCGSNEDANSCPQDCFQLTTASWDTNPAQYDSTNTLRCNSNRNTIPSSCTVYPSVSGCSFVSFSGGQYRFSCTMPSSGSSYSAHCISTGSGCDADTTSTASVTLSCNNECSAGEQRCSASSLQTCGNYDADSCLEFPSSNSGAGNEQCGITCTSIGGVPGCKECQVQMQGGSSLRHVGEPANARIIIENFNPNTRYVAYNIHSDGSYILNLGDNLVTDASGDYNAVDNTPIPLGKGGSYITRIVPWPVGVNPPTWTCSPTPAWTLACDEGFQCCKEIFTPSYVAPCDAGLSCNGGGCCQNGYTWNPSLEACQTIEVGCTGTSYDSCFDTKTANTCYNPSLGQVCCSGAIEGYDYDYYTDVLVY